MSTRSQKVEEIFQSALDHSSEQRAAYLDQAGADDAELRREVDSMISSYERAGSFIEKPALEVDAQVLAGATTDSLVGQSIGHYKILEKIGAGGMGEVYVAEDARLGRRVALKLLSPYLARDQEGVRRFQQEARAASTLNHPNVLTVYDTGARDGSPCPFRSEKVGIAQTKYLGMEHQTIIAYGNNFKFDADGFDWLMFHELGHEWWGNLVTASDWRDFWIHEGFQSFINTLYLERLRGKDEYFKGMTNRMKNQASPSAQRKKGQSIRSPLGGARGFAFPNAHRGAGGEYYKAVSDAGQPGG